MKDFLARELEIDDNVVIVRPGYRNFVNAKIVAFTKKQVRVEYIYHGYVREYICYPDCVIKIEKEKYNGNSSIRRNYGRIC